MTQPNSQQSKLNRNPQAGNKEQHKGGDKGGDKGGKDCGGKC